MNGAEQMRRSEPRFFDPPKQTFGVWPILGCRHDASMAGRVGLLDLSDDVVARARRRRRRRGRRRALPKRRRELALLAVAEDGDLYRVPWAFEIKIGLKPIPEVGPLPNRLRYG